MVGTGQGVHGRYRSGGTWTVQVRGYMVGTGQGVHGRYRSGGTWYR